MAADRAENIFLNGFRWTSELIPWGKFVMLLEGNTVHLFAPINQFAADVCIDKDTPIFVLAKNSSDLLIDTI